jgi:uncharacterized protein
MARVPENVQSAWNTRDGAVVFATVDPEGIPNAIYVTCVSMHGDDKVVIADNYLGKTQDNIRAGSRGAVLFLTPEKKSYQIKGRIEYCTTGEIYEEMKGWNPTKHPGRAAVVVNVEEVYSGSERIL